MTLGSRRRRVERFLRTPRRHSCRFPQESSKSPQALSRIRPANPLDCSLRRTPINVIGPLLVESGEQELCAVFAYLMRRLHILAVQSGEWGPFWQVAAGIDAACHDLAARKARLPLWRFLDGSKSGKIRAYASGIGPETPAEMAASAAGRGHTAFKLKVGFGEETDLKSLAAIRSVHAGNRYLAHALASFELTTLIDTGQQSPLDRLSVRERHVLQAAVHHLANDALRDGQLRRPLARRSLRGGAIADQSGLEAVAALAEIAAADGVAIEQHGEAALDAIHFENQIENVRVTSSTVETSLRVRLTR